MGLLNDLYLAPVDAVGDAARPNGRSEVAFGGMTDIEFSTLWEILAGPEHDGDYDLEEVDLAEEDPQEWVSRLPQPFVDLLAAVRDEDLPAVVQTCSEDEDLTFFDPEMLGELIKEFRALAVRALESDQAVYFYFAL